MMQYDVKSLLEFDEAIKTNIAALFYMSTPDCNVCKVLKPKMIKFLSENFPLIKFFYVNIADAKELAAQKNVFTVPTILFFFDGKEYIRKSRFINFNELETELGKIYKHF